MSELIFSICQNPEEVHSNASEGIDLLVRGRANRQRENKLPSSLKLWSRLKVGLPTTEDLD